MICCNKCGLVIVEPKEEPKEEESSDKGRYKKSAPKEEAPVRRPSLISMPTSRIVNGFSFEDVDLCEICKKKLYKQVNEIKFKFMTENSEEEMAQLLAEREAQRAEAEAQEKTVEENNNVE